MPPTFVYGMLGMFQVCAAVLGWFIVLVLSVSPGVRRYRDRLLGAVAGGAIGGFAGAVGAYVVTVGVLFLMSRMPLFASKDLADAAVAIFFVLSIAAYLAGVLVGGRALWRMAS
jgi:hypothetical protein